MRIWRAIAWTIFAIGATASASADDGQFFDSKGVRIHYVVKGEGEPVLLVHGFAVNLVVQWQMPRVIDVLAKDGYKVIALDQRGHGKSQKPHDPAAYGTQCVDDLVRLLDHLKIDKVLVVGYSMGAWVTLKFTITHPERVRAAVLGGAGWLNPDDARWELQTNLISSLEQGKGFEPLVRELTPEGVEINPANVERTNLMLKSINDVPALVNVLKGLKGLAIPAEQLKSNKVPVLCLIGDQDPLKEKNCDPMVGLLSGLQTIVIPGGDHMNTPMKPLFIKSLRDFLDKNRATPKPTATKVAA